MHDLYKFICENKIKNYQKYLNLKIETRNKNNSINNKIYGLGFDYIIIDNPIKDNKNNKGNEMFESNNQTYEGTRDEVLNKLKELSKSRCNKCCGRGYTGYKEDKETKQRIYIPCKCINKNNI